MNISTYTKQKSTNRNHRLLLISFSCFLLGLFLGWKDLLGYVKANWVLLSNSDILPAIVEKNDLDTLYIDLKFEDFQKIKIKRQEAIKNGTLVSSKDDFVKSKISIGENRLNCKIRLKGDLPDHWSGDKWSLRIEMKDGGLVKGMSRFSLQSPTTRNNTAEWMFLGNLQNEKCISVRYDFINLVINGKSLGIYAMEEHFSKEMIEANHRREGVIVNYDDYLLWKKFPKDMHSNIGWNSLFRTSLPNSRNTKRVNSDTDLSKQMHHAFQLLRLMQKSQSPASDILAVEETGKFLAITRLWSAERGLLYADINFYFNPITCKLEPIGFDGNPKMETKSPYCYFTWGDVKDNWVNFALQDQLIVSSYIKHLSIFTSDSYLRELKSIFTSDEIKLRRLLLKDLLFTSSASIWKNDGALLKYKPWEILEKRSKKVKNELNFDRPIIAYGVQPHNSNSLEIIVKNTTKQPVEIAGFIHEKKHYRPLDFSISPSVEKLWVHNDGIKLIMPSQGDGWRQNISDHKFIIPYDKNFSKQSVKKSGIYIQARFLGLDSDFLQINIPVDEYTFVMENQPIARRQGVPHPLPSFAIEDNNSILIPNGVHRIRSSIFIPREKKLFICPGTELFLDRNVTIISEGTLHAIGTKEQPIIFSATNTTWGGLLLNNIKQDSVLEHINFRKVGGIGTGPNPQGLALNGWTMTGGITSYKSPIHISNCIFEDFYTEDAINIVSTSFSLNDCTFRNVYSDAFDGDFVKGRISNSTFEQINGDGIDISGSEVFVSNCNFNSIKDKAISIGEGSQSNIDNVRIIGVSFGIVTKDLSQATISNSFIANATIAGFSAFQKKTTFGPAKMNINNSKVTDSNKDFLSQTGSSIINNNIYIKNIPLNIKEFYKKP